MGIETRLESLERSVLLLNDTIKELITLYIDTQTNPLLGDLPDQHGFVPKVIKNREARKRKDGAHNYSMLEIRELTEQLIESRGTEFTSGILGRYNIRSLAELSSSLYDEFAELLLEEINQDVPKL